MVVLEEDGVADAEYVFFVGDEIVAVRAVFGVASEVVVVDEHFLHYDHELVYAVDKLVYLRDVHALPIVPRDELDESFLYLEEDAVRVVEVLLQHHRKLQKNL